MPIGDELKQKAGPLPVWAWVGIGTVGLAGYLIYRKKQAMTAAAQSNTGTSSTVVGGPSNLAPAASPMPFSAGDTFVTVNNNEGTPGTTASNTKPQYVTTSKIKGPSRAYTPTSGQTLANLLLKNGLITKSGSGYKTTAKFGGPIRAFNPNAPVATLTAVLLKEGIIKRNSTSTSKTSIAAQAIRPPAESLAPADQTTLPTIGNDTTQTFASMGAGV